MCDGARDPDPPAVRGSQAAAAETPSCRRPAEIG
jgi:hypothetical protein